MKKIKKLFMMFVFALAAFMGVNATVKAAEYEFRFRAFNVSSTEACDLSYEGADQECYEKALSGALNQFEIDNGIISDGQKIMILQEFVPPANSAAVSIQYGFKYDATKAVPLEVGGYYGLGIMNNALGKSTDLLPKNGRAYPWDNGGYPNDSTVGDGFYGGFVFKDSTSSTPLPNTVPLSATFYTVTGVTPGSQITFEYVKVQSGRVYTAVAVKSGSEAATLKFTPLVLSVTSDVSTDGTLSALTATGTVGSNSYDYLDGVFVPSDSSKLTYSIVVPNAVDSLNFEGTPTDSNIKTIAGLSTDEDPTGGVKSLNVGDNEHIVTVTSEAGDSTIYRINIKRLSNDTSLSSISGTGDITFPTLVNGTLSYSLTVPYKTGSTTVTAEPTHDNAVIANQSAMSWIIPANASSDRTTMFPVVVNAEDCMTEYASVPGNTCTTATYEYNVTRTAPSKDVTLSDLKVDGVTVPGFSPTTYTYTLDDVASNKGSVNVTATVNDPLNSIISGTGVKILVVGPNTLKVIVKSESLEENITQEYTINIKRLSRENALQSLTVSQVINPIPAISPVLTPSFGETKYEYSYTYDPDATGVTITATAKDTGKAKVSILDTSVSTAGTELVAPTLNGATYTVATTVKQVTVVVQSEDPAVQPQKYVVDLSRKLGTDNYLSSLSINPGTIKETFIPSNGSYTAEVDANVTQVDVNAVLNDSKGRVISISGNSGFHFGAGNIITVVTQNETGKEAGNTTTGIFTYTINVTRKEYDIATLSDVRVGFGSDAKASIMSNFVLKQDGLGVDYYEAELYTQASPLPYTTTTMNIDFTLTNEYSTYTSSMNAAYISGQTYGKDNVAVNTGDNTYTITVKSQDESKTLNYKIKVYRQKNVDNSSGTVTVAGVLATPETVPVGETPKNFYVTLPNEKTSVSPSEVVIGIPDGAVLTKTTGTLSLSTTTDNKFNYTITSEDGVAENYVIHISRTKSDNASMTVVYLRIGEDSSRSCIVTAASEPGKNPGCTIEVPLSTTEYYLIPTIHSEATVSPTSDTKYTMNPSNASDSVQERNLTVTAEDTTSATYTITVKRALSADATLSEITVIDVTGGKNDAISGYDPIIVLPNKVSYNVSVTGDVETIKLSAVLNDAKASFTTDMTSEYPLSYGNNSISISVMAENNVTPGVYTLNVYRNKKTDATLKDLQIGTSSTIATVSGFAQDTTGYNYPPNGMDVSYSTTTLDVLAHVNDDASAVSSDNAIVQSIVVRYNDAATTTAVTGFTAGEESTATVPLATGKNVIEFTVAAQDRTQTKTYTITVNRARNTDASIEKIEVYYEGAYHEATKQADGTYKITVPNDVETATQAGDTPVVGAVKVTPTAGATPNDALAMWTVPTTSLDTLDGSGAPVMNNVTINVTPETGAMVPYTLIIERTPSSVKDMSSLNIYTNVEPTVPKACIFVSGNIECQISAETSTTQIKMESTLVHPKSSVTYSNGVKNDIVDGEWIDILPTETEKTITATVKAEDGTTKPYTIIIKRQKSADAYLKPIETNADNAATFAAITGFRREKTSYTDTPLVVPGTRTNVDIKVEVNDTRADIISIDGVAQATDTNSATYNKTLNYGINDVDIVVRAEDGTTMLTYTVRITRSKNIDADLADLQVTVDTMAGTVPGFNPSNIVYPATGTYNVDYDYSSLNLLAVVSDAVDGHAVVSAVTVNGTSVAITPGKTVNANVPLSTGANDVVVTVTAHDTTVTKDYTVNVYRALNDDKGVSNVQVYYNGFFHEATWSDAKNAYEITVPYNTSVAQGATKLVNGYVEVIPNSGKVATDALATISMGSTNLLTNDPVNGNVNTHKFTVTAEDSSSVEYDLIITRTKNDVKVLERVNVYKDGETATSTYCTFNAGVYNCDINLPVGTNNITLEGILSSASEGANVKFTKDTTEPYTFTNDYVLGDVSTLTLKGVVEAEDGTKQEYTINISRAKSSTSTLDYIKTDAGTSGTLTLIDNPFNPLTQTYNITAPYNQSSVEIEAKAADAKAKVTVYKVVTGYEAEVVASDATNIHNISIPLNTTGANTIAKVIVEPETGAADKRVYTITIARGRNEEPRLSDITINGTSINNYLPEGVTFDPDGREYVLNAFDYEDYSLLINGVNIDTTYGTLNVNGSAATPTSGVSVDIQTIHSNQTLPVTPPVSDPYVNTIIVKGIAQNTDVTKEYILKIKRKPSTRTDLDATGVGMNYGSPSTFHAATCDLANLRCSITVPNDVTLADSSNVVVTPAAGYLSGDKLATVSMGSTTLVTNDPTNGNVNEHKFTVTAEDGTTTKEYTLMITREKSSNAKLNDILVYDATGTTVIGSFNPSFGKDKPQSQQTYTVTVPVGTTEFKVFADPEYPYTTVTNATLDPLSTGAIGKFTLTASTRVVTVTSRSEDGSQTMTYTLNIQRVSESNFFLHDLIIMGEDSHDYIDELDPEIIDSVNEYTVEIPGTVNYVDITIKPQSPLATANFTGLTNNYISGTLDDGLNPDGNSSTFDARFYVPSNSTKVVNFTIKSEAGADKPYQLTIIRKPRTDATLKNLAYTLPGQGPVLLDLTSDPDKRDFVISTPVENNVTGINISAAPNDSNASVTGIGDKIIATGPNTYKIIVTAEDGVTKEEYTISIDRKKNNDATLSVLSVNGLVFNETFVASDPDHIHYTLDVDSSKATLSPEEILATPTKATSTVTKDPAVSLSQYAPTVYNVTVTAEDGVTVLVYTITVTRPLSDDAFLKSVTLTGATLSPAFDKDTTSYTITVPHGSSNFTIASEPNAPTSTVSTNGNTAHNLSEGSFVVTVTAQSGATKEYTFNITEAPSNDGRLTSLSVTNHTMTPTFVGTTFDYSIGEIENTYETLKVNATPSNANATVQYIHNGNVIEACNNLLTCDIDIRNSAINESKTIMVRVIPPAGETYKSEYNITYKKVRSTNAYLSDIIPSVGALNNPFNKGTLSYILDVPYDNDSVDLTFIAENHTSSLQIDGGEIVSSPKTVTYSDLVAGGTKNVTVKVIAENGTDNNVYNISIKRAVYEGGSDAYLSNLYVTDYPFVGKTFAFDDFDYSIGQIPYTLPSLTVNATPNDANATVQYYLDGVIQSSNVINISNTSQVITVKVISENRKVEKTYSISYSKVAKTNNNLSSIVVSEGTLIPGFSPNVLAYSVDVDSTTDNIDITAILADSSATMKINNIPWISGKVYTATNLQPGPNVINIVVTAEDGTPKNYKVTVNKSSETEVITSVEFGHNIENGYIMTVADQQTGLDMKNQLDNDNAKLEIWAADDSRQIADTELVGTGMVVKLIIGGVVQDSKIIIVKGDTTGDGKITTFDSADILNHFVGNVLLTGPALVAGDTTGDGVVSTFDSADVLNHFVGNVLIVFM